MRSTVQTKGCSRLKGQTASLQEKKITKYCSCYATLVKIMTGKWKLGVKQAYIIQSIKTNK